MAATGKVKTCYQVSVLLFTCMQCLFMCIDSPIGISYISANENFNDESLTDDKGDRENH